MTRGEKVDRLVVRVMKAYSKLPVMDGEVDLDEFPENLSDSLGKLFYQDVSTHARTNLYLQRKLVNAGMGLEHAKELLEGAYHTFF